MKFFLSVFLVSVLTLSALNSQEESGVKLQPKLKSGDIELVFNGAGTITKFFFKVYVIALYLEKKNSDAGYLLKNDVPFIIYMHFKRDGISGEKIIEAWNEGFEKSTNKKTGPIKKDITKFNKMFEGIEMNENDKYRFEYIPKIGTKVYIKDKLIGTIEGFAFRSALLGIWLGDDPRDKGVKKKMLGK